MPGESFVLVARVFGEKHRLIITPTDTDNDGGISPQELGAAIDRVMRDARLRGIMCIATCGCVDAQDIAGQGPSRGIRNRGRKIHFNRDEKSLQC